MIRIAAGLAAFLIVFAVATASNAERRVALVVGNKNYHQKTLE